MLKQQFFNYWQFAIQESSIEDMLFSDHGRDYTSDSPFVYLAFVDEEKDFFRCGWSMYKDYQEMLGFLEHVFIPTAYFNWLERRSSNFYLPVSDFDTVLREVKTEQSIAGQDILIQMKEQLRAMYHEENFNFLYDKCETINNHYIMDNRRIYIRVFENIHDVKRELFEILDFDEVFEEEMGMDKTSFQRLCDHLEDELFFRKRMTSYLNSHVPIMF